MISHIVVAAISRRSSMSEVLIHTERGSSRFLLCVIHCRIILYKHFQKGSNFADGQIALIFCVREPASAQVPMSDGCTALASESVAPCVMAGADCLCYLGHLAEAIECVQQGV